MIEMNVTTEPGDVTPETGERVLCVPQRRASLMVILNGMPQEKVPAFSTNYGEPYWSNFEPTMPHWGWGVLVLRDGVLRRGPAQWDCSD